MVKMYKKYGKNGLLYTHTVGVDHLLVGDYKVNKDENVHRYAVRAGKR